MWLAHLSSDDVYPSQSCPSPPSVHSVSCPLVLHHCITLAPLIPPVFHPCRQRQWIEAAASRPLATHKVLLAEDLQITHVALAD